MNNISVYTFLPWLRQGIANEITGQSGIRATIPVELTLTGDKIDGGTETRSPIKKDIELYGPGDITGIDPRAVIKVEPLNWITNFEPNYLPYIEFYDEDFPWRYSPSIPLGNRLHPWIMLIVLKEDEFKDGKNIKDRPLPYIQFTDKAQLPPPGQLWAWAHVHVNSGLIEDIISTSSVDIQTKLADVLDSNPDMAYSRIVCPRRLADNTPYHAFLVPVFESGRLAGLGQDPSGVGFDAMAWTDGAATDKQMPYYYRWYFRTGTVGDFEYLVRLLEPKPMDSRVGLRDMDVHKPGANIKGIVDEQDATEKQKLGGILKLGGALRIPKSSYTILEELETVEKYENWATLNKTRPYPHPFQSSLAAFINLTDSYHEKGARLANSSAGIAEELQAQSPQEEHDIGNNPDPLITAPLYARWHALPQRLLKSRAGDNIYPNDNWIHELNLDPRWRVAAGFGTKVVQENQEDYMKTAWEQVGEVQQANSTIRKGQFAKEVSGVWYQNHLKSVKEKYPEKWLMIATPLQKRVMYGEETVFHRVNESKIPSAAFSMPMRKFLRPRGQLIKRISFNEKITPNNLLGRLNEGAVSSAPSRITPPELNTLEKLSESMKPKIPALFNNLMAKCHWLKWTTLILALIILLLLLLLQPGSIFYGIGIAVIAVLGVSFRQIHKWTKQIIEAESILEKNQTVESVQKLPTSSNFRISSPEEEFTPRLSGADSQEAQRFKRALEDVNRMVQKSIGLAYIPEKPKLNMMEVGEVVFRDLNPDITVPAWIWGSVIIPPRLKDQMKEKFEEVKAYPEIDLPMYKPLTVYSAELFLPNINFIPQNSICLLETNQSFIESYMVGLNHEFARELLWREYPTDLRGSYFRQFWEPRGFHDTQELSPEDLKEKLRDIPPLHLWSKYSKLGDHDNRETGGQSEEEAVLVIRGELLKRYPNAVIYAHRAVWKDKDKNPIVDPESGQEIDPTQERDLMPLPDLGENVPPPDTIIKSPLYEAQVEPDIYFFGFDLTVCKAKGGTGKADEPVDSKCDEEGVKWDDPGWFFVIRERPGEPRFGLDIGDGGNVDEDGKIQVWNDLSWNDITPAVTEGGSIQITDQTQEIKAVKQLTGEDTEKQVQQDEDKDVVWHKQMSSAELAYILYQVPVLVAVHAAEMLPKN